THGRGVFKGQINNSAVSELNEVNADVFNKVYPNPSSSTIKFEFKEYFEGKYSVWSREGKEVLSGDVNAILLQLETATLPTGIYQLRLSNKTTQSIVSFSVQR